MILDESFWDGRYRDNDIGWDIGYVSTPLKAYFDQLQNKDLKILIPGGGNSYEAEYLHHLGFKNVYVADLSSTALSSLKQRVPEFQEMNLIHENFFDLNGQFDLIVEQTFFCAIDPKLRKDYASKINDLLSDNGKLIGLLFCIPLNEDHPPYGGSQNEYESIFGPYFNIEILEIAYNSIPERSKNELFIKFNKKSFSKK